MACWDIFYWYEMGQNIIIGKRGSARLSPFTVIRSTSITPCVVADTFYFSFRLYCWETDNPIHLIWQWNTVNRFMLGCKLKTHRYHLQKHVMVLMLTGTEGRMRGGASQRWCVLCVHFRSFHHTTKLLGNEPTHLLCTKDPCLHIHSSWAKEPQCEAGFSVESNVSGCLQRKHKSKVFRSFRHSKSCCTTNFEKKTWNKTCLSIVICPGIVPSNHNELLIFIVCFKSAIVSHLDTISDALHWLSPESFSQDRIVEVPCAANDFGEVPQIEGVVHLWKFWRTFFGPPESVATWYHLMEVCHFLQFLRVLSCIIVMV